MVIRANGAVGQRAEVYACDTGFLTLVKSGHLGDCYRATALSVWQTITMCSPHNAHFTASATSVS